jgi:hypothetical protein
LRATLSGTTSNNSNGLNGSNQVSVSFTYTPGQKENSTLPPLFREPSQKDTLSLNDLTHINAINRNDIQVAKKDYFEKHIVHVDKLGTNSSVEYDGVNVKVKTDL